MSPGAWRSQLIGILKRHKDVVQRNACDYGEHDRGGRVQQDGHERKPAHDKANANTAEATRMICGRNTKNSTARMIPPAIVIMVPAIVIMMPPSLGGLWNDSGQRSDNSE